MKILAGVSGECFDATLQIVRALVDYQNVTTTSDLIVHASSEVQQ
jgi:hypothetical protein